MRKIIASKRDLERLGLFYSSEEKKLYKWVTERTFSSDGEIVTKKVQRAVNQTLTKKGYIAFVQRIKGQTFYFLQHNLEWFYSHPTREIPDGFVVCHIDKNKLNNEPSNLQLISFSENLKRYPGKKVDCRTWLGTPEVVRRREATKAARRLQQANKDE